MEQHNNEQRNRCVVDINVYRKLKQENEKETERKKLIAELVQSAKRLNW